MKLQVGVKLLFKNQEGLYLLIQRSEPLPDGSGIKWDVPGGRINSDERLDDALKREVQEEIGVVLDIEPKLVSAQDIIVPDIELHVVRLTYVAQLDTTVVLSEEHQNFQWVNLEDALASNVDPYLREVLEGLV